MNVAVRRIELEPDEPAPGSSIEDRLEYEANVRPLGPRFHYRGMVLDHTSAEVDVSRDMLREAVAEIRRLRAMLGKRAR